MEWYMQLRALLVTKIWHKSKQFACRKHLVLAQGTSRCALLSLSIKCMHCWVQCLQLAFQMKINLPCSSQYVKKKGQVKINTSGIRRQYITDQDSVFAMHKFITVSVKTCFHHQYRVHYKVILSFVQAKQHAGCLHLLNHVLW